MLVQQKTCNKLFSKYNFADTDYTNAAFECNICTNCRNPFNDDSFDYEHVEYKSNII